MNKKEIIAIALGALLVLLVLASAHAFGETENEAGNACLIFDDPSLDNETYAAMNFENMENITAANISVKLGNLQEGNIWAFYETESQNGTATNQSLMLELYYLNGMLHIYKYKTLSYAQETTTTTWPTTIYRLIVNDTIAHTDSIVGYAHDGDILSINYHLTKEDGTGYANTSDATGNISIRISIENSTYNYNSHTDSDSPQFITGFATTPAAVNGSYNFSRGMMFGSFDDQNLGKAEFSIDNLTYDAQNFNTSLYTVGNENFTAYYNHFFHTGETLTDSNSTAYAIFAVSSPARIYVLDAPLSAPSSILYIPPSVTVSIQSWFLSNAWWLIPVILVIILADLFLDVRDLKEDKK